MFKMKSYLLEVFKIRILNRTLCIYDKDFHMKVYLCEKALSSNSSFLSGQVVRLYKPGARGHKKHEITISRKGT